MLEEQGDASGQLAALEAALLRAPGDARVQFALGTALGRSGEHDRAIEALQRSVELDPRLLDARVNLGVMYLEVGRTRAGLDELERVLASVPHHPVAAAAAQRARTLLGRSDDTRPR